MKNQALVAGIVCFILGGVFGFLAGQQVERNRPPAAPQASAAPSAGGGSSQLPDGHPPIPSPQELETLKQAAKAAPNNASLLTDLANKLYDAGRFDEAVGYYEQVLALDPGNVGIITDLGTALFYLGRTDEAIARFNQSLQIEPRHVQTLHNLVVVYAQGKQDMIAAGDVLERLVAVDPVNPSIPQLRTMLNPVANQGKANTRQRIF